MLFCVLDEFQTSVSSQPLNVHVECFLCLLFIVPLNILQ